MRRGPPWRESRQEPGDSPKQIKQQKGPFHMAEIVVATRQAVSLNGFSASTK
nr:MAG TPA: hypothetical protein [Caudoviricetes sp.]DAL70804.1 MAG TPA: hypothetical protein [Caudoviricetes sp.]DAZ11749.1 MAG TPA: hypothetical protein [Caudoviricetes sp.]